MESEHIEGKIEKKEVKNKYVVYMVEGNRYNHWPQKDQTLGEIVDTFDEGEDVAIDYYDKTLPATDGRPEITFHNITNIMSTKKSKITTADKLLESQKTLEETTEEPEPKAKKAKPSAVSEFSMEAAIDEARKVLKKKYSKELLAELDESVLFEKELDVAIGIFRKKK